MNIMAELKTKENDRSPLDFLNSIADEKRRQDSLIVLEMMKEATKAEPKMWGDSIVGFGKHHLKYKSGRELDWFLIGFSPRKQFLTLYINTGFPHYEELMSKLGKYKTGKSCLYIKKIEDVNLKVLKQLINQSVESLIKSQ